MYRSKRKAFLALIIVMLVICSFFNNPMTASANSSETTASVAADEATLKKCTADYINQFINNNFDEFYQSATKKAQQQITASVLKQGWDMLIGITGKPGKVISSTYTQQDGVHIVSERLEGTLYDIIITITYLSDGHPDGIHITFAPKNPPKPQSTKKWKECPVTVGKNKLPGMLTLPKGVKKPPVIIMIQGSGSSDMNESFGTTPNRMFEDIAHGLANQGVATLRYNKRTYQYPFVAEVTIEYEMLEDAASAVKLLSKDTRIDTNQIYLLGHSLGGMLAPKITADNPKIKGFISMAGTLRPLEDVIYDQDKAAADAETSLSEQQKSIYLEQVKADVNKVKNLDSCNVSSLFNMPINYWKSLNAIDRIPLVKKLKVPMLIMQGAADFQVYPDKDFKLWKTTLKNHKNVTYRLYEGLSHMFMTNQISENGAPDITLYNAPNHVDPSVINDIAIWVKKIKK